jgi:hypothetical protein
MKLSNIVFLALCVLSAIAVEGIDPYEEKPADV